jgi:DNA-binding CsgD family transcriptional regulator
LQNIDRLKLFVHYFKDKMEDNPQLFKAYDIQWQIEKPSSSILYQPNYQLKLNQDAFLNDINIRPILEKKPLNVRELSILSWLHQGKTLNQIAEILHLSEVTVKKYIATIKTKTACYTQFQLGEYFSSITGSSFKQKG